MTDIVEKLRNPAPVPFGARPSSLMDEAADEIERLRTENKRLQEIIDAPVHAAQRERARKGGACDD